MKLGTLLVDKRATVAESWYDAVLSSYPPETAKLWKRNQNPFTNPVGNTIFAALNALVVELVEWRDATKVCGHLEEIIKIRAVQDMTPAKALSFIFQLKRILREQFAHDIEAERLQSELTTLESRLDNMALMGFDIYARSRETVFRMRVEELKRAHHMLFRKAGLTCPEPGEPQGSAEPESESA